MRKLKGSIMNAERSRGVVPGGTRGAGGAMEPPDVGRLCPPINTGTPGFSNTLAALRSPL